MYRTELSDPEQRQAVEAVLKESEWSIIKVYHAPETASTIVALCRDANGKVHNLLISTGPHTTVEALRRKVMNATLLSSTPC